jgi:excisionase family DNA binding protein
MKSKDRWVEVSCVAQRLAVSTRTVYRLLSDGCFEFSRISPRTIRIKSSSVDDYLRRKTELASFESGLIEDI